MTFLVSYDESYLADAALTRATEYADALDEDVVAVAVIPEDDERYAREKNWLEKDEEFDVQTIASFIHEQVVNIAPEASFRYERSPTSASSGIATELQRVADDERPSVVFLGSDNAGQIVTPVTSVAGNVAEDATYDVHIVRYFSPTAVQEIEASGDYPGETR
ncbi:universal stress protein [Haloarchaeobius amylolyticus]|uniref:Universal stress protein n=1 Tax=Haloarchaeobius amylolyticus TaxID=1198296 RepID=A0ABD6BC92_9EURY